MVFFADEENILKTARWEHLNSGDLWHRVYPRPISNPEEALEDDFSISDTASLPREDQLLHDWFRAMCRENAFYCQ